MSKLALCLIVKDTPEEALLLDRCLENMSPHVDGIFITASTPIEGHVKKVAESYNANYSEFEWVKDFSKARNFNFSQVPKDYKYIMWSDADDVWRGLEKLRDYLETGKDAYAFWYLYDFDEDKQPIIAHKKTMIVKNDGSFIWKGEIHEDLDANRSIDISFIEDIDRLHLTNEDRKKESAERNLEIAQKSFDENDPRSYWNLGNSLMAVDNLDEAYDAYVKFLHTSQSDDEKYLVLMALADICNRRGDKQECIANMRMAIGMKPNSPDAYFMFAKLHFNWNDFDAAEESLLSGLVKKPTLNSMIVFNPRDYDYNPMMLLAKVYFHKSRPDLALTPLEACYKINPNKKLENLINEIKKEKEEMISVLEHFKDLDKIDSIDEIKQKILSIPDRYQNHPMVCNLRNTYFVKEDSTGKDIAFYCGMTSFDWNPKLFREKGFGGSEEAIIHLSKYLAAKGMNVTVYNSCGSETMVEDGVTWKPFWAFNPKDKWDTLVLWRSIKLCDYDLNAGQIFIDVHDTVPEGEFTEERLKKIDKIFLKSKAHRVLYPNISDDKIMIIPNGLNVEEFASYDKDKDKNLIINTSSPDRSMESLLSVYSLVKKEVPEAKLHWAYGWDLFDKAHQNKPDAEAWKNKMIKRMNKLGVVQLGKIPQHEANKLYCKANILLYPTEFYEIDCISVRKAQLGGCYPITSDFAALNTTNHFGSKLASSKNKDNWAMPYQFEFSIKNNKKIKEYADEVIAILKSGDDRSEMIDWASGFSWESIGEQWYNQI